MQVVNPLVKLVSRKMRIASLCFLGWMLRYVQPDPGQGPPVPQMPDLFSATYVTTWWLNWMLCNAEHGMQRGAPPDLYPDAFVRNVCGDLNHYLGHEGDLQPDGRPCIAKLRRQSLTCAANQFCTIVPCVHHASCPVPHALIPCTPASPPTLFTPAAPI